MAFKNVGRLVEARIEEARRRGEFDALPGAGTPLDLDDLAGLSGEALFEALLARSTGGAPLEVSLLRRLEELREQIERERDAPRREALREELRRAAQRLAIVCETNGRPLLANRIIAQTE